MSLAMQWVEKIRALGVSERIRVMNVCGGHERTIVLSGMQSLLPPQVELLSGPGCAVCVCPQEDICLAMQLALIEDVILVTLDDMLRIPIAAPEGMPGSMADAMQAGADVRTVSTPYEAAMIAESEPDRQVVFFVAGYETTMAPVATLFLEGVPANLSLLLAGRLTWPVVDYLLASESPGFDALLAPGHVAAVMGPEQWDFVPEKYHVPVAIAPFTPVGLLAAVHSVIQQHMAATPRVDNCYKALVHADGNNAAADHMERVFDVCDANWRGIGRIAASGYKLRNAYVGFDARVRFAEYSGCLSGDPALMPSGCDCSELMLGHTHPTSCAHFARDCQPGRPLGPCMGSNEGVCRIWWSKGHDDVS